MTARIAGVETTDVDRFLFQTKHGWRATVRYLTSAGREWVRHKYGTPAECRAAVLQLLATPGITVLEN